jgi:hypothetical protein
MAQRIQVTLVCDVHDDETAATETVGFALDGSAYEIDVCERHAGELRDRLASYIGVARKRGGAAAGRARRKRTRGSGEAAAIREWARSKGIAVPERGRIPADIAGQYAAASR